MRASPVAVRLMALQASSFFMLGIFLPYFPLWLAEEGLSAAAIGTLLAATYIIRAPMAPVLTFLADRNGDRRRVFIAASLVMSVLFLLAGPLDGWTVAVVLTVVISALHASTLPLTESLAVWNAAIHRLDYPKIRAVGSLGFAVANIAMGFVIGVAGDGIIPYALAASVLLLAAVVAWIGPAIGRAEPPEGDAQGEADRRERAVPLSWRDALALARHPVFLLFLLSASLVMGSHGVYYNFSTLVWREQGVADGLIGVLWAVAVVVEILFLLTATRFVSRLGAMGLLFLGAAGALVRWLLMATAPEGILLLLSQSTHALSFAATHLGCMMFLERTVPPRLAATAQGLFGALSSGLFIGFSVLVGGYALSSWGALTYLVPASFAFAGFGGFILLRQVWRGERLETASAAVLERA